MKYAVAKLRDGSIQVKTIEDYKADPQAWDWVIIESIEAPSTETAAFKFALNQARGNVIELISAFLEEKEWELDSDTNGIAVNAIEQLVEVFSIRSLNDVFCDSDDVEFKIFQDKANDAVHYCQLEKDDELFLNFDDYILSRFDDDEAESLEEVELNYWE